MTRWLIFTWLVVAGCGEELICGTGTHAEGDQCVASLSPQCGAGTRLENGSCVPDSGGGAECGVGTHSEGGTCVPDIDLKGNAARFYDVNLTAPADFIPIANAPFHESFITGENLVFIGTYAPNPSQLRLYGGGGLLNENGSYTLDRAKAYDTAASIATGSLISAPFTFQMKAFGAPQPIVLVDTVISNGTMDSPEGVTLVQSGSLSGVLTPENAMAVYIEDANLSLYDLINTLEIPPDVDHDHNGSKESWTMAISFATIQVWLF